MESDPGKLAEALGRQEAPEEEGKEKSGPDVKDAMLSKESGDEDESVILNKSGKGYSLQKHKELRVENHLIFG